MARGLAPLRHRGFRLLAAGQLASNFGDAFYAVALPWFVLAGHGGALLLGTVLVAYGVPRTVLLAVGGHASDRWRPWTVMLGSDAVRAVAVAALAVAAALGPARAAILVPIAVVLGAGEGLFLPGSFSIIPALLPDDDLQAGNALASGGTQLATLAGPAIGGALVAFAGPSPAFAIDAASFAVSAATLAGVRFSRRPVPVSDAAPAPAPPAPVPAPPVARCPLRPRPLRPHPLRPAQHLPRPPLQLSERSFAPNAPCRCPPRHRRRQPGLRRGERGRAARIGPRPAARGCGRLRGPGRRVRRRGSPRHDRRRSAAPAETARDPGLDRLLDASDRDRRRALSGRDDRGRRRAGRYGRAQRLRQRADDHGLPALGAAGCPRPAHRRADAGQLRRLPGLGSARGPRGAQPGRGAVLPPRRCRPRDGHPRRAYPASLAGLRPHETSGISDTSETSGISEPPESATPAPGETELTAASRPGGTGAAPAPRAEIAPERWTNGRT